MASTLMSRKIDAAKPKEKDGKLILFAIRFCCVVLGVTSCVFEALKT